MTLVVSLLGQIEISRDEQPVSMRGAKPVALLAYLLVTVVLSLIGFGVFTALYSLIYSLFGPSQYGPLDSPPLRRGQTRRR